MKFKNVNPKIVSLKASFVSMIPTNTNGILLPLMVIIVNPYPMFVLLLFAKVRVFGISLSFLSVYYPASLVSPGWSTCQLHRFSNIDSAGCAGFNQIIFLRP